VVSYWMVIILYFRLICREDLDCDSCFFYMQTLSVIFSYCEAGNTDQKISHIHEGIFTAQTETKSFFFTTFQTVSATVSGTVSDTISGTVSGEAGTT